MSTVYLIIGLTPYEGGTLLGVYFDEAAAQKGLKDVQDGINDSEPSFVLPAKYEDVEIVPVEAGCRIDLTL